MAASCENCPILTQCNNVYDRVARQTQLGLRRSRLYDTPETRQYEESIEERINSGMDVDQQDREVLARLQLIGQRVSAFESRAISREAALEQMADAMLRAMASVALCDGPHYGPISSWFIATSERTGAEEAKYFKIAYAKCVSPELYGIHREIRQIGSDIASVTSDD